MNFLTFLRDERGSATIEFVIWVPIFMFLLLATVDTCLFFLDYTRMLNASRETVRRVTTGELTGDTATVQSYVNGILGDGYTASVEADGSSALTVVIRTDVENTVVSRVVAGNLFGKDIIASTKMRLEPGVLLPSS